MRASETCRGNSNEGGYCSTFCGWSGEKSVLPLRPAGRLIACLGTALFAGIPSVKKSRPIFRLGCRIAPLRDNTAFLKMPSLGIG